jgi:Ca-activated chloride channel family protein
MRFADPNYLWLLLVVPVALVYLWHFRANDIPALRFSSFLLIDPAHRRGIGGARIVVPGLLRALALVFMILALARPQRGLRSEEMTTKATDIVLCLDASRSMLAIDFKPDNRFHVAKSVIADFIKGRQYDRLGLVLFAEYAITQCPLTTDRSALLSIVDSLEIGAIAPDQTAIGTGLATAVNRLKNSEAKSKIIILVTDGANNAGSVDPLTAAKAAAALGIKIYTIGSASPGDTMIPIDDPSGGQRLVPIRSDLDEDALLRIAEATGGKYYRAKNTDALKSIFKEIDALEKTDIKVKEYTDYEEYYVWFLLIAVGLVTAELLLNKTLLRTLP